MPSYNVDGTPISEEQKKELRRAARRRYYEKNKEKCLNYSHQYYIDNKQRFKEMNRQRYLISNYLEPEDVDTIMNAIKD